MVSPPPVTVLDARSDDDLVAAASTGDRDAFAALYERYFSKIYDFALRIVRNPDGAADVVQSAFASAWEQMQDGKPPQHFKAWLYTVARNKAIDERRHAGRELGMGDGEGEAIEYAAIDAEKSNNPQAVAQDNELAGLVWEAAAALSPSEYALLDMHLRQDLDADELSSALGVSTGAIYTRLSRLRSTMLESVSAALLMQRGRRDCADLDRLLEALPTPELDRRARTAITRHVKACDTCRDRKERLIAPEQIFAGLGVIAAASGLHAAIWARAFATAAGPGPIVNTAGAGNGAAATPDVSTALAGQGGQHPAARDALVRSLQRAVQRLQHLSTPSQFAAGFAVAGVTVGTVAVLTIALMQPGSSDQTSVARETSVTVEAAQGDQASNGDGVAVFGAALPTDAGLEPPPAIGGGSVGDPAAVVFSDSGDDVTPSTGPQIDDDDGVGVDIVDFFETSSPGIVDPAEIDAPSDADAGSGDEAADGVAIAPGETLTGDGNDASVADIDPDDPVIAPDVDSDVGADPDPGAAGGGGQNGVETGGTPDATGAGSDDDVFVANFGPDDTAVAPDGSVQPDTDPDPGTAATGGQQGDVTAASSGATSSSGDSLPDDGESEAGPDADGSSDGSPDGMLAGEPTGDGGSGDENDGTDENDESVVAGDNEGDGNNGDDVDGDNDGDDDDSDDDGSLANVQSDGSDDDLSPSDSDSSAGETETGVTGASCGGPGANGPSDAARDNPAIDEAAPHCFPNWPHDN